MKDEVKYYEQMKSSIVDKFRLIDHLVGETVLEIGFGGGDLTMEMLYNGYDVYGIDSSIISLQKAQAPMIKRQKEKMFLCDAFDAFKFFKGMKFDNIVLSSVLHEIFSYKRNEYIGYNKGNIGVANEIVEAKTIFLLKQLTYLLNDSGKILIRDSVGIEPSKSFNMCSIKMDEKEKEIFDIWYSKYPKVSNMYIYDNGILKMHKSNMMEFMYTLTWGKRWY